MSPADIRRAVTRIAHEIVEHNRGTEQLAGGNVGHLQVLAKPGGLRAFARSGRSEYYQSHEDPCKQ
jgi:hypothetical protein